MSLAVFFFIVLIHVFNMRAEMTHRTLEELSDLVSYLRVWKLEKHISLDVLMPPEESYFRGLYFQVVILLHNIVEDCKLNMLLIKIAPKMLVCLPELSFRE